MSDPNPTSSPGQAQQAQAELRQYFPTPVGLVTLPTASNLNPAISELVLAREANHPSVQHSNLGGWQSSWDLDQWGGPAVSHVLASARSMADKMTASRQGGEVRIPWQVNAWANINRQGQGNEFHTHPGAYWSGTYYVEDGGLTEHPDWGGEFEFQDPRGVAPAMYAPHLTFAFPAGQSAGASELISPRAGMLLVFPAWLSHAVRPYRGSHRRISLAFNFSLPAAT